MEKDIIDLWNDGWIVEEIADELGLCETTVLNVLEKEGLI